MENVKNAPAAKPSKEGQYDTRCFHKANH